MITDRHVAPAFLRFVSGTASSCILYCETWHCTNSVVVLQDHCR